MPLYSPVTLLSGGLQDQGNSLLLLDKDGLVADPLTVLVIQAFGLNSEGVQTPFPLLVSELGATSLTIPIPQDGLYSFQGIRIPVGAEADLEGTAGDIVYFLRDNLLHQSLGSDGEGNLLTTTTISLFPLTSSLGEAILYLHLTSLTRVYNKLLLRYLHYKLGPLEQVNGVEASLLDKHLGRLERGLEGAKYLFQDQNYPEASRTVELLTQTRYL